MHLYFDYKWIAWHVLSFDSDYILYVYKQIRRKFYVGAGQTIASKHQPCPSPKISAYRCQKEHSVTFKIRQNAFLAGALPWTPLGELMALTRIPSQLGRGHPSHIPPYVGPSALAMAIVGYMQCDVC